MKPTSVLEKDQHPSSLAVFSRLILLATAMMALSYGLIKGTVAMAHWLG